MTFTLDGKRQKITRKSIYFFGGKGLHTIFQSDLSSLHLVRFLWMAIAAQIFDSLLISINLILITFQFRKNRIFRHSLTFCTKGQVQALVNLRHSVWSTWLTKSTDTMQYFPSKLCSIKTTNNFLDLWCVLFKFDLNWQVRMCCKI